ncbi:type II toxin-antitoxin system PemK/MazF family toxin [Patescibacteria group bacterium]|nr:type II toxin-antitoxin system PemK/MazF family toxin [Patescibacteria group bacterium]MBU2579631.1 type II toxin-antitoxin system PemK/MazF family toxin [Patescibacteria group bacterium]MBU4030865.1 type II toxin-antitoxin system PemK/MazF family toxin [Patescibacteria group bacterium]
MSIDKKLLKQGEIFLVNFDPSFGYEYQGKRPAVIIESEKQIRKTNLITVVPLTSNLKNKMADDILITKNNDNKLISDSIIKVYNVCSFDYLRFINKIGIADVKIIKQIKDYLKKHFDI